MKKVLKSKWTYCVISILLIISLIGIIWVSTTNQNSPIAEVREYSVENNVIDHNKYLESFSNSKISTNDGITSFQGSKFIDQSLLSEIDNLSETDLSATLNTEVKFNFTYNDETGEVTLRAILMNSNGVAEVEEIKGQAFYDENGNIDATLNLDGEIVLLSEMQDNGMIENCGWFSRLFKKVTVAVVAVVAVAAVASFVVATAGAGLGAVIAVGAAAGAVTGGVAGGVISYSEYGKLDWKWVVGGAVIGGALGAVTGWGVGTAMGVAPSSSTQVKGLINTAKSGKLDFSSSIKSKSYFKKGNKDYRAYYEQANTISQEIMKAKKPITEIGKSGTKCLKWTVEGAQGAKKGVWELIIDPATKNIVHFLFRT